MASCESKLTPEEFHRQQLLKKREGVGFLYPPFAEVINDLLRTIQQHQMPFQVYETYRTPARQKRLVELGLAKIPDPLSNPHVHGLAVDFLLDYRAVRSLKPNKLSRLTESDVNQRQRNISDDYGGVYNLGVNMIPTTIHPARTKVEDKVVLDFWNNLGLLIERQYPQLVWGGKFNLKRGELIGTDPPHVEFRDAPTLIKQRSALRVLRANGNPGLEEIKL